MESGGPSFGKPDQANHTIYRGQPHPENPKYSGFRDLFGVYRLRLQRLGSCVGFGTGTREAPNKSIRLVRVSFHARRIGARAPSVRAWRRQEALFGGQGCLFIGYCEGGFALADTLSGFIVRGSRSGSSVSLPPVSWVSFTG